jgi:hypothetical protein
MLKHLRYLLYVLRHKRLVYREGRKLGLGRWRLLTHDLSKFSRAEWGPYVEWFYGREDGKGWRNAPSKVVRTETRYTITQTSPFIVEFRAKREAEFQAAWQHHYRNNSHHWEYWLFKNEANEDEARQMGWYDRLEMIADWKAAGLAIHGRDDVVEFYDKNKDRMNIHPQTRLWVEEMINRERKVVE